jgi:hypothetical protein
LFNCRDDELQSRDEIQSNSCELVHKIYQS